MSSTTDYDNMQAEIARLRPFEPALARLKRAYDSLEASTRQQIDDKTAMLKAALDEVDRRAAATP